MVWISSCPLKSYVFVIKGHPDLIPHAGVRNTEPNHMCHCPFHSFTGEKSFSIERNVDVGCTMYKRHYDKGGHCIARADIVGKPIKSVLSEHVVIGFSMKIL